MTRRFRFTITIAIAFGFLITYIVLNDLNYRAETKYHEVQIRTYEVFSDWSLYVGMLRSLISTTETLEASLEQASLNRAQTEWGLRDLQTDLEEIHPAIRQDLSSFLSILEEGLRFGDDIVGYGYHLLEQEDLPAPYRDGRVPLSNLIGKDIADQMGPNSAYQYFQMVRRLKSLNNLFDQIYLGRLDGFLINIDEQIDTVRRQLFISRLAVLGLTTASFVLLILYLISLNRYLSQVADQTKAELSNTRNHLSEVQGYLSNAEYQQSLFEMTAGVSHELNGPLGNSIMASSHLEFLAGTMLGSVDSDGIPENENEPGASDFFESLNLLQDSLRRMKRQIDTFKRLSSINEFRMDTTMNLGEFIESEIPRITRMIAPFLDFRVHSDLGDQSDLEINIGDLNTIITHITENSRDHANAKLVDLMLRTDGSSLNIIYQDDGIGVEEGDLLKISEPFFTTARGQKHMGLGLSIISSLIGNKLRGTVNFSSGGGGLRINIVLPLRRLAVD